MVKKLQDSIVSEIIHNTPQNDLVLVGKDSLYEKEDKEYFFKLGPNGKIPDEFLLKALELSGGNITRAARLAGVNRKTYTYRMNTDPIFKEKALEIREMKLDFAEDVLWTHISQENLIATMFYLKTIGKERGYVTSTEIVGSKDRPVNIQISMGNTVIENEEYDEFA